MLTKLQTIGFLESKLNEFNLKGLSFEIKHIGSKNNLAYFSFPENIITVDLKQINTLAQKENTDPLIVLDAVIAHEIGHFISYIEKGEFSIYNYTDKNDLFILENNAFVYGLKFINESSKEFYISMNSNYLVSLSKE